MVENLLKPGLTCKFLVPTIFFLVIDVILLDLDPMVAEGALQQVGSSNVILRRYEKLKACFMVVGRHVKKQGILKITLDVDHVRIICRSD